MSGFARKCASPDLVRLQRIDDPFIPEGWELIRLLPRDPHGLEFYVFADPHDRAILISENPDAYSQFIDTAEIDIDSPEAAIEAVEFALIRTPEMIAFRQILRTPSDLVLDHYPGMKEKTETARKNAKNLIDAPAAQRSEEDGYQVTLYLQQNDTVQRWQGRVTPNGAIEGELTQVIADLPVIILDY